MEILATVIIMIIAFSWYLYSKKKNLAKDGQVLQMKQKTQEQDLGILKDQLKDIPEEQKNNSTPDNVIDFWNKKK